MGAGEIGLCGLAADTNLGECCQSVWIGIVFPQRRVDPLAGALEIQLNRAEPVFSSRWTGFFVGGPSGRSPSYDYLQGDA